MMLLHVFYIFIFYKKNIQLATFLAKYIWHFNNVYECMHVYTSYTVKYAQDKAVILCRSQVITASVHVTCN